MMMKRLVPLLLMPVLLTACASMSGMQQRFAVCSYDHAWDAALDAVKDRAVVTKDKEDGMIVTGWLEIPMPGRTFGALQRDLGDSRDRSRITLVVKRLNDVTKISFTEERQRWAFRGGSRLFGWASTDPSAEVMADVQSRLDTKLKEQGCSLS
ncbi:hypothetical protein [Nitrospira lenta]|uniref:Lipoprotein n=1 Tax=Nitrospira lenta TaxID=1436998 RepID=A0A330L140_9BACT|nr:hypothetical protein [Nitrospira lenta]SPP63364.1 conserved exported hypothetical protein [Nitrospira lenta]